MNQTKKRLSIINLAISITDIETIQLQMLKLGLLKTDEKIQEIIATLQNENYAQTQALIATYIETPNREILQRTSQKEKEKKIAQDKALIEEFDLFTVNEDDNRSDTEIKTFDLEDMLELERDTKPEKTDKAVEPDINTLNLDDMLKFEEEAKKESPRTIHKTVNFDSLLNVDSKDILPDNIDIDISHASTNDFWDTDENLEIETENVPKDTFFDEVIELENTQPFHEDKIDEEILIENKIAEEDIFNDVSGYQAITYIDQKFKNMQVQYPPVEVSDERFETVDKWLLQISNHGYTEEDVEAMITKVDTLRAEDKAEAAQLLLISAATVSKYAQFILARTLYKGDILEKNSPEAFTLINRLAVNDDYPEAICDLAQFYEYGVGIDKDRKKAELLYEEAMNAGIKRADEHFERLKKQNSGLFSFLKK